MILQRAFENIAPVNLKPHRKNLTLLFLHIMMTFKGDFLKKTFGKNLLRHWPKTADIWLSLARSISIMLQRKKRNDESCKKHTKKRM